MPKIIIGTALGVTKQGLLGLTLLDIEFYKTRSPKYPMSRLDSSYKIFSKNRITKSKCINGKGGQKMGRWGKNKEHRSDALKMTDLVVHSEGQTFYREILLGNNADVKGPITAMDSPQKKFRVLEI